MEYTFKNFYRLEWNSFLAWLVMQKHLKWADQPTETEHGNDVTRPISKEDDDQKKSFEYQSTKCIYNRHGNKKNKAGVRYPVGVKQAKSAKEKQLRTQAVSSMEKSAKRKSKCL